MRNIKTFEEWLSEKLDESGPPPPPPPPRKAKKQAPGAPPIPGTPGYKPGHVEPERKKPTPEEIAEREKRAAEHKKLWQGFGAHPAGRGRV